MCFDLKILERYNNNNNNVSQDYGQLLRVEIPKFRENGHFFIFIGSLSELGIKL